MRPSLRRRLLAALLTTTTALWLLFAYVSYRDTQHELGELFDAQLAQAARTLLQLSAHEFEEDEGDSGEANLVEDSAVLGPHHRYEQKLAYQIWQLPQGKLLIHSRSAPIRPLAGRTPGFSDQLVAGRLWRIFTLTDRASDLQIHMGQSYAIRNELSSYLALRKVMLLIVALPLMALLITWSVRRGLVPLQRLTDRVTGQEPTRLEPLDEASVPTETLPLVHALNALFARLQQAFERETRFTADAAHELRTPLAALKIQAQVLERASNEDERSNAVQQVLRSVNRAGRLVDQLLTLSRIDPDRPLPLDDALDLTATAREVIGELAPLALAKGIELSLEAPEGLTVTAHPDSLYILLRNLLDNAIRYTPPYGKVEISAADEAGEVRVQVDDSGPGIPADKREQVLERFTRLDQTVAEGSGLGLSIVTRIIRRHGAGLSLDDSPLGGLRVAVSLQAGAGRSAQA